METIAVYFVKSSGLIGLFFCAYFFLLKKETFFNSNRWFLLAGLFSSAFLPFLVFTKTIWIEPSLPSTIEWSNIPITTSTVEVQNEINWYMILAILYAVVFLYLTIKLLLDLYSLKSLLKNKIIQQQSDYKFINVSENIAPFSFFNYIVYNAALYNETELNNILEHEKIHCEQKHTIDVLVSRLFSIVFWFNPFIWLYKKAMIQNLEFIADSEASKKFSDTKSYQMTLLKITTNENCVTISNHFYQSLIKKRIIMLNKNQSNQRNSWKYTAIIPALVAFVFLFQIEVLAQEKQSPKPEDQTKSKAVDLENFKIDKDLANLSKGKDIYIDGKKSTKEELDKLDPNEIAQIDVIKKSNKPTIIVTTKNTTNQNSKTIKITDKDIYIDGVKSTNEEFNKLDQSTVDKVDVNNIENTIRITTKTNTKLDDKTVVQSILKQKEVKPLIIVDGSEADSNFKIQEFPTDKIESINVLKGIQAVTKYSEKGKNGVIEITTKKTVEKLKDIDKIDFIITKNTTDKEIKEKCQQIKEIYNVNLTFFNIKRNINGEIINIESKNDVFPRSYKQSKNPIEPFKFFYEKKTNGGFNSGYSILSNSISRIIEDKTIDYKKAVILIDGKLSDYKTLEKMNPKEVKQTIIKDINSSSSENKQYFELYGEKTLNGIIEIITNVNTTKRGFQILQE